MFDITLECLVWIVWILGFVILVTLLFVRLFKYCCYGLWVGWLLSLNVWVGVDVYFVGVFVLFVCLYLVLIV